MSNIKDDLSISVVVPVYNGERYLQRCLDSIIAQSYRNLEILLVDDGSTDTSLDICKKYQVMDKRIKVLHQQNSGQNAARMAGIRSATGYYITFVDVDDYIEQDAYEIIIKSIDSIYPEIIAYGMKEEYFDDSVIKRNHFQDGLYYREEIERVILPKMLSFGEFFDFGLLPNLVCKFVKREFINRVVIEVDNSIRIGEDADVTFQLAVNANTIQMISVFPYHYCKRNDSMMWINISPDSIIKLKMDLEKAFKKAGCIKIMQQQLEDYISFIFLLKSPKSLLDKLDIFKDKRIAIYGAGGFGQAIYNSYKNLVTLWVDKNFKRYKNMNLPVSSISNLQVSHSEYDIIFIAILDTVVCQKIKKQLLEMGIKKQILYYKNLSR